MPNQNIYNFIIYLSTEMTTTTTTRSNGKQTYSYENDKVPMKMGHNYVCV